MTEERAAALPGDGPTGSGAGLPTWHASFRHAVVRLATYVDGAGAGSRLVLATIELLTPGRPRPASGPLQRKSLGGRPGGRVFFRRVAIDAAGAISWYMEAARGHLTTPVPSDHADGDRGPGGIPIAVDPFVAEPAWPDLVLPLDGNPLLDPAWPGPTAPFVGSGADPARVSRLLAPPHAAIAALARDEAVIAFLRPRLHLDLSRYPEYRGGMVLIAPDPVTREIRMFVRPRPDQGGPREDVVVRILPRDGADLSGLELTLIEVRGGGLHDFERMAVPRDGLVVWPRRQPAAMVGYVLTHAVHGVLRQQAPTAFLRRISMAGSVASRRVSIHAPATESPTAEEEQYSVTEYAGDRRIETPREIGEETGLSRIHQAGERRRRLAAAESQGQRWLDDPDEARAHLRRIVEGASERVWVADPYLGGRQIFQFIHAIGRLAVEIRLITSRLAFEGSREPDPDAGTEAIGVAKLAGFADGLRSLEKRGFADVEAWILRAKNPPLHDRFLVVDGAVWFSGNSLNALGARAGLIIKVPDPDPVIARLAELRDRADPFDTFLDKQAKAEARRRRTQAGTADPGAVR